jgi:hypothetical protein
MGAVTTASEDTVDIKIATPLPSSVLLTLSALVDAAYPGSSWVGNDDRHTNQVIFRINNDARRDVSTEEAAALRHEPGDGDVDITALGPEGVSMLTPLEVAANLLPVIKTTFAGFPDAENYLEMPIHDPSDGNRYLLTFCRSRWQTPHELRMKAEKDLADARGRIHREYAAAAWGVRTAPRPENAPDTFNAGVNAVLDVLRNLSRPVLGDDND